MGGAAQFASQMRRATSCAKIRRPRFCSVRWRMPTHGPGSRYTGRECLSERGLLSFSLSEYLGVYDAGISIGAPGSLAMMALSFVYRTFPNTRSPSGGGPNTLVALITRTRGTHGRHESLFEGAKILTEFDLSQGQAPQLRPPPNRRSFNVLRNVRELSKICNPCGRITDLRNEYV